MAPGPALPLAIFILAHAFARDMPWALPCALFRPLLCSRARVDSGEPMSESPPVKIYTAEFKADPFPFFARLRAEQPVFRTVLPDKTPVWLVTRYNEVLALLKDERFAKNRRNAMTPEQLRKLPWTPAMFRPLERNMLDVDPPDHERLRLLVHKAFTPRLVEQMRGRVQAVADELLTRAARRGKLELVRDFALPLPVTVITEILGVPAADRGKFHKWSQAIEIGRAHV